MEWGAILVALVVFAVSYALLWTRRPAHFPPGPRGWPLIGHLHWIDNRFHLTAHRLYRKYGPVTGECTDVGPHVWTSHGWVHWRWAASMDQSRVSALTLSRKFGPVTGECTDVEPQVWSSHGWVHSRWAASMDQSRVSALTLSRKYGPVTGECTDVELQIYRPVTGGCTQAVPELWTSHGWVHWSCVTSVDHGT